jgi:hypothetical protein
MVDSNTAIRFVTELIAAKKDKLARMRAQVDGLLRSIEDTKAEIAALEGTK